MTHPACAHKNVISSHFDVLFVLSLQLVSASIVCDDEDECSFETISSDNVYCRGFRACRNDTINGTDGIYCGGQKGCEYSDITTITGSIYCDGWLACWKSKINVIQDGVIECRGRRTCKDSTIKASEITTVCTGGYSCENTNIESDTVDCDGYYGCINADISGQSEVNVNGERGGYGVSITITPLINVHGYYGLQNGYISSDGVDTLELNSNGEYSLYNTDLECFSGTQCIVNCGKGTTCENFNYYCYDDASCSLSCDSECSTNCPSITNVSTSSSSYFKSDIYKKHQNKRLKAKQQQDADETLGQDLEAKLALQLHDIKNSNNNGLESNPIVLNGLKLISIICI